MSEEDTLRAAVNVIVQPILRLLQADPHQWSERPCSTCRAISEIVGQPFGCYRYALDKGRINSPA